MSAQDMDLQKQLLKAANTLAKDEVRALVFLCDEMLQGSRSTPVDTASQLFNILRKQDRLSPESPHLLTELLTTIEHFKLVRELNLQTPQTMDLISPFRKLLYTLSMSISVSELDDMKFLLHQRIPRLKLEQCQSTLDVFLEMEHRDLLSNNDLNLLEDILEKVHPVLIRKITKFKEDFSDKETTGNCHISVPEETPPLVSKSCYEENQVHHPQLSGSGGLSDVTNVGGLQGDTEDLACGLTALTTRENNPLQTILTRAPGQASSETDSSTNACDEAMETYSMNAAERGMCLIVNNFDFKEEGLNLKQRKGTMVDADCLEKVFQWLGFEVRIQDDCSREKILSLMQELGTSDHSRMDCFVCCVLSHGAKGSVYGVDGSNVKLTEIMQPFNGLRCPSLVGKPKIFFIQACQGTAMQTPVNLRTDSDLTYDAGIVKKSLPCDADCLLAVASIPNYVSIRDKKYGTWFIQSLCQNLIKMVPKRCHLVDILTKVNNDVSHKTDRWGLMKQMSRFDSRLTKNIVFPVPQDPPPQLL